uniref:Uncharacterized protein n=1 Tax=Anguilla anguilla TaxID=7936 RepID=A0A0E9QVG7_ANGAN
MYHNAAIIQDGECTLSTKTDSVTYPGQAEHSFHLFMFIKGDLLSYAAFLQRRDVLG